MKKLAFIGGLLSLMLWSCGHKQTEQTYEGPTTADSLRVALANQDSLLSLINDINDDMTTIRRMEDILSTPGSISDESESARQRIKNDMAAIQAALHERRVRLAELEKKLQGSYASNATLKKTIESLKAQIAVQDSTIASFREELAHANIVIEQLNVANDSLATQLTAVNEAKEKAEEATVRLGDEINTCYFIVGTNKELNNAGVIKSGFLRKTRILPGDVDTNMFVKADKRTLTEINCHSDKAKVMTDQPESSYQFITEANDNRILVIKNPEEFWKKSNFLVIKID